jgi:hypothetical protein
MFESEIITSVDDLNGKYGSIEQTFNTPVHMPKHLRLEIDDLIECYLRHQYGDRFVNHVWEIRTKTWVD